MKKKSLVPKSLEEFAQSVDFPVVSGLESGHGFIQRPVPFGPRAELSLGRRPHLVCKTGCMT